MSSEITTANPLTSGSHTSDIKGLTNTLMRPKTEPKDILATYNNANDGVYASKIQNAAPTGRVIVRRHLKPT